LVPDLAQARLVLQTACLRPVTPDWLPIIGQAPSWDNVYLATGAGKKGILLSPGMGKAIADLMTQGSTSLSIGPCAPERFSLAASSRQSGEDGSDS
jgi:glycine/D-amino acid oxidase-like deaminating enzyme